MIGNKKFIAVLLTGVLLTLVIISAGCVTQEQSQTTDDRPVAVCTNGTFIGTHEDETGVVTFKGIPFAKQPVGDLRWKAPQKPETLLDTFEATEFSDDPLGDFDNAAQILTLIEDSTHEATKLGHTVLQPEIEGEPASLNPQGEDCLTLNVWTKNLENPGKAVMVFIHGGGYFAGGSADPMYNGQYLAAKDDDIIVVTINYRLNTMGFIDFSGVEGGEEFPDAPYLGLLDVITALEWIQENIVAFGGDPKNVTIFGESAGAGMCGILLSCEDAKGLFHRAILESGDAAFTSTRDDQKRMKKAECLLKVTGSENMDDLMALSEDELKEAMLTDSGIPIDSPHPMKPNNGLEKLAAELETYLVMKNTHPLRGVGTPIPENPYLAIANGVSKDVDVLVGTNTDETRYFVNSMFAETDDEKISKYYKFISEPTDALSENSVKAKNIVDTFFRTTTLPPEKYSEQYPGIWEKSELFSEFGFRLPAIKTAESHIAANGSGKTYMYLFGKKDSAKPHLGSGHAAELPYVFNSRLTIGAGNTVDPVLADKISSMWINFAKTGDPSIEGFEWPEYTIEKRATMFVGNDSSLSVVNDPKSEQRKLLMPLIDELFPMPQKA